MDGVITKLWIDESGDSGFKFVGGSSRFLVIACVYLTENDAEEKIGAVINELRLNLHLTDDYEFKFSRCKNERKKKFFESLIDCPIEYKAIVTNKTGLIGSDMQNQPHQLYCEMIRRVLYDNNPPLKESMMILDETIAKIHHTEFNGVLKKYLSKNVVAKIRQVRSQSNPLIQVADMIAGSIFRLYEKGNDEYYEMIKAREKLLITF